MPGLGHRDLSIHTHGLVNPLQVPEHWCSAFEPLCLLPRGFERHRRMMPLLVEFKSLPEQKKLELLEVADEWACGSDKPFFSALLTTDVETKSLGRHLARRMILRVPDAGSAWLRFHDPCVYGHLCWLLSESQMAWLMGPVSTWTWRDALSCHWVSHYRSSAVESETHGFSAQQWKAVEEFEFVNRYLREARGGKGEVDVPVARQVLDGALEATSLGLMKFKDKCAYVDKRLLHGPGYIDSESHKVSLDLMGRQKISYFSAIRISTQSGVRDSGGIKTS